MKKVNLTAEPGVPLITSTRFFDAPPDVVYRVYTDPALIPQWWGPGYLTTTVEQMEVRPGGTWRYVQRDPQGNVYAFHGVYHSVPQPGDQPRRLVSTFEFEGEAGHVSLDTAIFEPKDGGTLLTAISSFQSVADRDGMLQAGMESGYSEGLDRLEKLAEGLTAAKAHS